MTAYEMRISDWSSDVCSSDLISADVEEVVRRLHVHVQQLRPDPDQVGLARSGGLGGLGAGRGVVLHGVLPVYPLPVGVCAAPCIECQRHGRSEEHTSELQSLMRISYADCCLKKKHKPHIN